MYGENLTPLPSDRPNTVRHFGTMLIILSAAVGIVIFVYTAANNEIKLDIRKQAAEAQSKLRRSYSAGSLEELLKLNEDEFDIATAALLIEKEFYPDLNVEKTRSVLDNYIDNYLQSAKKKPTAREVLTGLCLWGENQRHEEDTNAPIGLISNLLLNNRGNCLSHSTLLVAAGRRLGLPLDFVSIPMHVLVRHSGENNLFYMEATNSSITPLENLYCHPGENIHPGSFRILKQPAQQAAMLITNRSSAWLQLREYEKSLTNATQAIKLDHENPEAGEIRANAYCFMGDYEKAEADFAHALELNPYNDFIYLDRSNLWVKTKEYAKAIDDISHALRLDATNIYAYINRSAIWNNMGEYEKAVTDATRAIELNSEGDPELSIAYGNRGTAYMHMQKLNQAINDFNQAIELDSQKIEFVLKRAATWSELQEYDKAITDYTAAIALDDTDSITYVERANACVNAGKPDKGIADYTRAIELDPDYVQAYVGRISAWLASKKYDKALDGISNLRRKNLLSEAELKQMELHWESKLSLRTLEEKISELEGKISQLEDELQNAKESEIAHE